MDDRTAEATASTGLGSVEDLRVHAGAALHADLCSSLLDGMHSMAQPLTSLQARFHIVEIEEVQQAAAYERLLEGSREVEHLCELFHLMQEILHEACTPVRQAPVALAQVLQTLGEDAEAAFAGYGLRLAMSGDPGSKTAQVRVAVDPGRTRKGLAALLALARQWLVAGAELRCSAEPDAAGVEITLHAAREAAAPEQQRPQIARLQMALAAVCLGRGADAFEFSVVPFRARFTLDAA